MFTATDIVVGFVLPGVVCAVILVLAWRPWRRGERAVDGRWAGAIAIGVGYAIGYWRLVGDLRFPPSSPDNWILYLMPVVMGVGVLFCSMPPAPKTRVLCVLVVCALLNWLLIKPLVGEGMSRLVGGMWVVGGALGMTVWWLGLNKIARRGPRVLGPAVAMMVAAGAAAILGDGGLALRGGFPLGVLAVELAATCVIAAWAKQFSLAGGGTTAVTLVVLGTVLYGYHYIYPEPGGRMVGGLAVVLAAPALGSVIALPRVRRLAPWARTVVGAGAVALAVATGVLVAGVGRHPGGGSEEARVGVDV
jgi:hypothetical protein